jgi:muramidase (phage lysozyme)
MGELIGKELSVENLETRVTRLEKALGALTEVLRGPAPASDNVVRLTDLDKIAKLEPLLALIRKAEAGGNYNAYYGNSTNSKAPRFTTMNLAEVLSWQDSFVERRHSPSSAVGAYQIIRNTLRDLMRRFDISSEEVFNPETQDTLALRLLEDARVDQFVDGTLSPDNFMNRVARIWASFPMEDGRSYYAGDGLNKALVKRADVAAAVRKVLEDFGAGS